MKYKVGDKVKIVSEKPLLGWNPKMDKWLGKVMTIKSFYLDSYCMFFYCMFEDSNESGLFDNGGGWFWWEDMIEGLASEIEEKEEFFVGDWVIIVDNGQSYSSFFDWFKNNHINKDIRNRYVGGLVKPKSIGRIVASAPHGRDDVMLYAIDIDDKIYLVGESGLARIKANIGDSVIITNSGYSYPYYDDWFTENKIPFGSFHIRKVPLNGVKGTVISIAPHSVEQHNRILYLIDTFHDSFLMEEDGFEKRAMSHEGYTVGYDLNEASFKREYECIWTETNETNPDKLFCIEDDREVIFEKQYLTAGKIYEFDGHKVNYDCGSCANFENRKDWIKSDPNLSKKLVKLTKRTAKIGDIIYYEKTVKLSREEISFLNLTSSGLINVKQLPINLYFDDDSFELTEKDYYVLDFEYKYDCFTDKELMDRFCYSTKCTAEDCFLTPYPCHHKDVIKDYCLRPEIIHEFARRDKEDFKKNLKIINKKYLRGL